MQGEWFDVTVSLVLRFDVAAHTRASDRILTLRNARQGEELRLGFVDTTQTLQLSWPGFACNFSGYQHAVGQWIQLDILVQLSTVSVFS